MSSAWEKQKQIIKKYWVDDRKPLKVVVQIMKEKHGFSRSENTYNNQFKKWGVEFDRKHNASSWAVVGSRVQKRDRLKKKSCVHINGKLIPEAKLRKEISRHYFPSHEERYGQVPSPRSPAGVEISVSTPQSLPDPLSLLIGLPWLRFQADLMEIINGASYLGTTNKALEHDLSVDIPNSALAKIPDLLPTEAEMRAILPVSVIDFRGPALGETATSILNYFNLIVYLVSNTMISITDDLFTMLEIALSKRPFLSLLLTKTPTTRAFIQQVFIHATISRENKAISILLDAGLLFDAWILQPDLPLKLAIEERNTALAKRLIEAGADLTDDRGCEAIAIAAKNGDLELVSFLIEMGADPNPQNTSTCYPALFQATERNDKEMVELLLNCGADINMSYSHTSYPSPLVNAAQWGDLQLVRALLYHDAHTEDRIFRQQTALGIAADRGHSELARELLDAGASAHPPAFNPLEPKSAESSALYEAVETGHRLVVQLLLRYKADPNTRRYRMGDPDATGRTALFAAVTNQNNQIVQILLEAGARVNELNLHVDVQYISRYRYRKETALHQAVRTSNTGLVQTLLNAGATAISPFSEFDLQDGSQYQNNFSNNTASLLVEYPNSEIAGLLCNADPSAILNYGLYFLDSAVQSNDIDLARVLLSAGIDVNGIYIGSFQRTALQHAVNAGNFELSKLLLDYGANVNAPPTYNYSLTALQSAVNRGSIELVQVLLSHGADVNAHLSKLSRTALQTAVDQGSIELVQVLLSHGANVNVLLGDSYRSTVLQSAVDRGSMELVQVLLSHGADVNAHLSKLSRTALQRAVNQGSIELVQLLLSHGADVNAHPSKLSRTALQIAVDQGSIELVQMLLSHGADIHAPGTMEYGTALQSAAEAGDIEVVMLLLHIIETRNSEANVPDHQSNSSTASNDWRSNMLPAAAKGGLFEIVSLLLTGGADINTIPPGTRYGTALQEAVGQYDLRIVHLLLDYGADPNIPGPTWVDRLKGWRTGTALQTAVDTGDLEFIRILIESGARADIVTSRCSNRRTPLEAATVNFEGDDLTMLVQLLLAAGADVELTGIYSRHPDRYEPEHLVAETTILSAAIHSGNVQLVKILLEAGANVNAVSTYRDETFGHTHLRSPLQGAVALADLEMSKILLKAGADVRVDSPFLCPGLSPPWMWSPAGMLATAILRGNVELFQLLLDSGAIVNSMLPTENSITALGAAAQMGNISIVEALLKQGAEVDGNVRASGGTALKQAATNGHTGIAFALLEAGADPTLAHPGGGGSPLVEAATRGRIDMLQMFLNAIKSRSTSGKLYVEWLESSLEMALERSRGKYNIAMGMMKTEIEDSKSAQ